MRKVVWGRNHSSCRGDTNGPMCPPGCTSAGAVMKGLSSSTKIINFEVQLDASQCSGNCSNSPKITIAK